MLTIVVIFVLGVAIGIGVFVLRQRSERQVESGITSFRREMQALAPPERRPRRRATRPDARRSTEEDDHGS